MTAPRKQSKKRRDKRKEKQKARIQRLAARLTLLNSKPPKFGWSDHKVLTWHKERENLIKQLKKHGMEME